MNEHIPESVNSNKDEIDLEQFLGLIRKGLLWIFRIFLRFFTYIQRNILWLALLAIIGTALGFGLSRFGDEKLKTEVVVKPNLESKRYLTDAVKELNAKIKARDTTFFSDLEMKASDLENFEILVEDLVLKSAKEKEAEMKYLELLQEFEGSNITNEIVRNMLLDQNPLNQRIVFFYTDPDAGPRLAEQFMDYLNSNSYFGELVRILNENALSRIAKNEDIIKQLDAIIVRYTEGMNQATQAEGQLVLAEEDQMNIADLFELKNVLIGQTEAKRIELQKRKAPLSIINFGKTQPVKLPLFGNTIFLLPFILIALFILKDFIRYLNRKSKELLS